MFAARRLNRILNQIPIRQMSSQVNTNEVWIVGASRTPVGSLNGALKTLPATQLGSIAIKHAVDASSVPASAVEEVFMGHVIQAGAGQSPARQAALGAGLPESADATTINKVCASGLKSIILGAQQIQLGNRDVVVAGGMESMSNAPFLISRQNPTFGNGKLIDSMQNDGLWEVYNQFPMGNCAEHTASTQGITRQDVDAHAIESYKRASDAWKRGAFDKEIAPVVIKDRRGTETSVKEDEEYKQVKFDKIPTLKPVFKPDGIVTAANASNLNDGASAVVLVSRAKGEELGLTPLAKIISYADAALKPIDFPIAPTVALPAALKKAGLTKDDIAHFEINEAFSVVIRAAEKILDIDPKKVNPNGGAVALGHAIGNSGSRIVVSLVHALKPGEYGAAGVCNGVRCPSSYCSS
ncbi:erg10, acetyl-CoA C-acetyltransferase [Serendipita sp. 407]|nr:erg10, acetyl-CoA C-acetyltransferase [Serendipita sp. 407]